MIASAYAAHVMTRAAQYGIRSQESVSTDLAAVVARKNAIVGASQRALNQVIVNMEHRSLIRGSAFFTGDRALNVAGDMMTADRVFWNVGARATIPPMPGISQVSILTNTSLLQLTELPEHLVIVGGRSIGLEFAQMFRRFGSKITIVEMGERLLPQEDEDFATAVHDLLISEGCAIRLKVKCIAFTGICNLR